MKKIRGLKFSIIALIIVLTISAFSLLISNMALINISNKEKSGTKAADLTISTYNNLRDFSAAVLNGNTYAGKTVVLGNNIDCRGSSLSCIGGGHVDSFSGGTAHSFEGTFDGQGHTLSNFTLVGGYTYSTRKIVGQKKYDYYHYYYLGLFAKIGSSAVIKRVKVSSVSYSVTRQADHKTRPTYHNEYKCQLVANRDSAGTLTECWATNDSAYLNVASVTNLDLPSYLVDASGGRITSTHTTTGISAGATGGSSGTTWYYCADYYPWPRLRVFLSWETVSIAKGSGVSSISPSSIKIPNDASGTFSSSSNSITIYGQKITAVRDSSYCNHANASWTCSSATSYTVNYNKPSRNLTIKSKEGSTETTLKTDTISCCSTLSVSTTGSASKYTSCTIKGYTYTAPITHVITSISHSNGAKISANTTVTINVSRKTYNVVFG